MKSNIFTFLFITILALLTSSCKKQEPLLAEPPRVINLEFEGITTAVGIEVLYRDRIIFTVPASDDDFHTYLKIGVNEQGGELKIREQGATDFILTRPLKPSPYDQSISVYYDGNEIYNQMVTYDIKGYAMSGELEFLLDGKVVHEGSIKIAKSLAVMINENSTRRLDVRKKGTTTILITKTIESSPATGQSLGFFFDGINMVDNVQVSPPANPTNMSITTQFKSTIIQPGPVFIPGNLDLVFFTRNKTTNVIVKTSPEIRIPLKSDGSFTTFELPPLPGTDFEYRFDIYQSGATTVPYDASAAPVKILEANQGRYGTSIVFAPGESKLFLINDNTQILRSPNRYVPYGQITDLSQYFQ